MYLKFNWISTKSVKKTRKFPSTAVTHTVTVMDVTYGVVSLRNIT